MAKKQKRLQSLSLATGTFCDRDIVANDALDLSQFKHLRTFRWTNILADNSTLLAFRAWFNSEVEQLENLKNLENLELQFIEENAVAYDGSDRDRDAFDPESNSFCDKSLGLYLGDRYSKFPSLKTLSLGGVCITPLYTEIAYFFNFSRLHTLRLRGCPFAGELLATVAKSSIPIKLTTFEYSTARGNHIARNNGLDSFLKSFRGLEYLYLDIHDDPEVYSAPVRSIVEHKLTLKHLAYNFSWFRFENICGHYRCTHPGFAYQPRDYADPSVTSILQEGKLTCFSFSDSLVGLVRTV